MIANVNWPPKNRLLPNKEREMRARRKQLVGTVTSDKMDKTVVVRVERLVQDPRYKKYVRRYSRFMAHDETNDCQLGDRVRIRHLRR